MNKKIFETKIANKKISFEFDLMAKRCNSSVLIRCCDTVILATSVISSEEIEGDFLPLVVNYEERFYAAGKIPGGYIKREGRPTENAILTSRLIDRMIRPLFDKNIRNEIQIVVTVFCIGDINPDILALLGVPLMLCVSDIPFNGPVSAVKSAIVNNKLVFFPTTEELEKTTADFTIAGKDNLVTMIESSCNQIKEDKILDIIGKSHKYINDFNSFISFVKDEIGSKKINLNTHKQKEFESYSLDLIDKIKKDVNEIISNTNCKNINYVNEKISKLYEQEDENQDDSLKKLVNDIFASKMRDNIIKKDERLDKRRSLDIRKLNAQIDFLPRTHGSAIFSRGETQVMSICTLGTLKEDQRIDNLGLEESKKFMLHYNFYPFSTGEVGRIGPVSRREVGHGSLGEKAFKYLMPDENKFPYTIRVVSEVTDSNGSTSQASICACTMALLSAGVPIKESVAGIAMGLIKVGNKYKILNDIRGIEDQLGDMDFKIAGTSNGVTALQLDVKFEGLNKNMLKEIFQQAKDSRNIILNTMNEVIKKPRYLVSEYAPKAIKFKIDPDKIKIIIGPNGKQINSIIEKTQSQISIEQDGTILVYCKEWRNLKKAQKIINDLIKEIKIGQYYNGKIKRIERYGIFVEIIPGKEALVHISKITKNIFNKIEDIAKIGDYIKVKITDIDERGKIKAESIKMET